MSEGVFQGNIRQGDVRNVHCRMSRGRCLGISADNSREDVRMSMWILRGRVSEVTCRGMSGSPG